MWKPLAPFGTLFVTAAVAVGGLLPNYEPRDVWFENEWDHPVLVRLDVWSAPPLSASAKHLSLPPRLVGAGDTVHLGDVPVHLGTFTFVLVVEDQDGPLASASETYQFSWLDDLLDESPDSTFERLEFIGGPDATHGQKMHVG